MVISFDLNKIYHDKMNETLRHLFKEVSHLHLRPLLGHVRLHLGVRVVDYRQEHVLHSGKREKAFVLESPSEHWYGSHTAATILLTMRIKNMKKTKVVK